MATTNTVQPFSPLLEAVIERLAELIAGLSL